MDSLTKSTLLPWRNPASANYEVDLVSAVDLPWRVVLCLGGGGVSSCIVAILNME